MAKAIKKESELLKIEKDTKKAKTKAIEKKMDKLGKPFHVTPNNGKGGNIPLTKPSDLVKIEELEIGTSFCFRLSRNKYFVYAGKTENGKYSYHHKNRPSKLFFENKNVFVVKEK